MVDDDPAVLEALKELLEARSGAQVRAFSSAEEAMMSTSPSSFDVCVLDYRLTGTDGLTLGAMLHQMNPDIRLILISGELTPQLELLALEHGFGRIFVKPFSTDELLAAIAH
jgi:DNA-binding NtrC family response regulator